MTRETVSIDLALQGGGAHGAFTWGVLDRLLEESWLKIEGISGTSAGAMNAAALISGYVEGGPQAARAALELFWGRVSDAARLSPLQRNPMDVLLGNWTLDTSPLFVVTDLMSRLFSPYDLNPKDVNPLRRILAEAIDFEKIARAPIKIFVTATSVSTGRARVFRNADVSPDALLASACLPTMFQAVEIEGEIYWDGGYSGNPTITPLVRECKSRDTILVQINPIERRDRPRSATEIANRLNEVSFNAVLLKELRMIALLAPGRQSRRQGRRAMGRHAHASHLDGDDDVSQRLLQAPRRMEIPVHVARRGTHAPRKTSSNSTGTTSANSSTLDLDAFLEGI